MKTQTRLKKGKREPLPSCVIDKIKHAVERDAIR